MPALENKQQLRVAWYNMKNRCDRPNHPLYKYYGARGIIYCDRWKVFQNFYDDMVHNSAGLTLDRIDNNKNYCKENCRWVTRKTQANNRRKRSDTKLYTYKGKVKTLAEWAKHLNIPYNTLYARIVYYKWPIFKAFSYEKHRRVLL